ncbi:MAG: 30S ribosomal protein S12 methylthiotransferase RimO [Sedimentisphaerales bacterium]|nr:30S ribosomal protein S12 methylthiotransferase RimO [Sedimentisphaerales bacterium]
MKDQKNNDLTIGFISLGCPKNTVDSERMLAEIAQAGFLIAANPEDCDILIINTCGFIEPAKQEAFNIIRQAIRWKSSNKIKKLIVAGCLVQRIGQDMLAEFPKIDAIVGLGQRDDITEIIKEVLNEKSKHCYIAHHDRIVSNDRTRLLITPAHWAYLRISEGCDHTCSFCTIPSIRGRFRSKSPKSILEEASELTDAGVVELNLIAQDTASYGRDLKIKDGLANLITDLERIDSVKWLRLMYLYPVGITDRLIDTIAESKKIAHYLDIPIQHINNNILKAMRRPDTKENICNLIEKLRLKLPDIVLRTTVIVGFPGETDKQFEELLDFIKWARFDALGCFKYYAESGTEAAKMPNQVPENVKDKRVEELMLAQQRIAFGKNQARNGTELTILVDTFKPDGSATGRYYGQAPEIDSVCILKRCSARPGSFIKTKVTATKDYDLIVKQI